MWGNALGWVISLVIVVATVGGIVLFQRHLANLTPPTDFGRDPATLAALELPTEPAALLPPRDACDAGPIYRQAVEVVLGNLDEYETFATRASDSDEAKGLQAIELLSAASDCSQMTLFTRAPHEVVNYGKKPELTAIKLAGKCCNRLATLLAREKRHDEAIKHYKAAFALGARLYEERLVLDELLTGLELMSESASGIAAAARDAGDAPQSEAFAAFAARCAQYRRTRVEPMWHAIGSIDAGVIARHTGDVFHVARRSTERMWRVEAILKLGRLRYNAARVADQQAAGRVLQRLSDDPDPIIRDAAKSARELTIQDYRMLG